jgi:hypothetical protein
VDLVFVMILFVLALATTLYRLFVRIRIQRWGWDDWWLVLATLNCLVSIIFFFLPASDTKLSRTRNIVVAWAGPVAYLGAVWCARLSIAASIQRFLVAPRDMLIGRCIIILLFLMGCGILFGKIFQCGRDRSWEKELVPVCPQPVVLNTVQLTCMYF